MLDWNLFWRERTSRERILNFGGILFNAAFARHIAHHIGSPLSCGSILEVGTGRGVCSSTLRKMGYNCISVDSSVFATNLARSHGLDVVLADGYRLPFVSETFELVFTQGLLEHLCFDQQLSILMETHRVAKKAIHSVPAKYGLMDAGERIFSGLGTQWPYPDEKKFRRSEFIDLLTTTFRTVRVENFFKVDWIGYCQ